MVENRKTRKLKILFYEECPIQTSFIGEHRIGEMADASFDYA